MIDPAIRNTHCGSDAIQLCDFVYTVYCEASVTIKTKQIHSWNNFNFTQAVLDVSTYKNPSSGSQL